MPMPDTDSSKPLNVLVADDSVFHQRLTTRLLQREGHQVSVVGTGKEAANAVFASHYDVVLMDVEMPEMDGLTATRRIRNSERQHGGHVPIIAFTSVTDAAQCKAAGVDAHLLKPSNPEALRNAIRHATASPA